MLPLSAAGLLAIALLLTAVFGMTLVERLVLSPGVDETRLEAHRIIWSAILDRPWFGYGAGSQIQGNFRLEVTGPDDLQAVTFTLDGEPLGTDTEPPFQRAFVTDDHPDGWHEFGATGITASGQTLTATPRRFEFVDPGQVGQVMGRIIGELHAAIREGESIAEPLANQKTRIFDDLVINMIDVGEKTGELDKMLIKVADNYDDEVDVAVASLTSLLEPLLIVVMGGAVFCIVLALFLPLLSIIDQLTGGG